MKNKRKPSSIIYETITPLAVASATKAQPASANSMYPPGMFGFNLDEASRRTTEQADPCSGMVMLTLHQAVELMNHRTQYKQAGKDGRA